MAEFMMLMKGSGKREDWAGYINKLIKSGMFRGGSDPRLRGDDRELCCHSREGGNRH